MWQMKDLRDLSIREMEPKFDGTSAVDQLLLGQKYSIGRWIYPAVEQLVLRKEAFSEQELENLGFGNIAKIWKVRDEDFRARFNDSLDYIFSADLTTLESTTPERIVSTFGFAQSAIVYTPTKAGSIIAFRLGVARDPEDY
jgi:hypothetical protein